MRSGRFVDRQWGTLRINLGFVHCVVVLFRTLGKMGMFCTQVLHTFSTAFTHSLILLLSLLFGGFTSYTQGLFTKTTKYKNIGVLVL